MHCMQTPRAETNPGWPATQAGPHMRAVLHSFGAFSRKFVSGTRGLRRGAAHTASVALYRPARQAGALTGTHWLLTGVFGSTRHTGTVELHPQSSPGPFVEFRHCARARGGQLGARLRQRGERPALRGRHSSRAAHRDTLVVEGVVVDGADRLAAGAAGVLTTLQGVVDALHASQGLGHSERMCRFSGLPAYLGSILSAELMLLVAAGTRSTTEGAGAAGHSNSGSHRDALVVTGIVRVHIAHGVGGIAALVRLRTVRGV
jgi:hypothetical protein